MKEKEIQKAVAETLNYSGAVWFHCPNERDVPVKRMMALKRQGLQSGVPDCIICSPANNGKPSALEIKAEGNRPTDNQQRWLNRLSEAGWNANWTVGLDESLMQLRDWGYLP